jgi:hypothetical protein
MKPYIIAGIIAAVAAYVFIGIPLLTQIVSSQGVMVGYPLEIVAVLVLAYLFAGYLLKSRKLFVLFMIVFLVQDIITPPIMIPLSGATQLDAGQQVAGDVFLYTLFTSQGLNHITSWLLTYLIVPILLLILLAYELRTNRLSALIPHVIG